MKAIALPNLPINDGVAASLDFVVDHDQWDDWVPDVVYWRDIAKDRSSTVHRIQEIASAGSMSLNRALGLEIFSDDALKFRTAALPLAERVLISAVIASRADVVQRELVADRLSGFELHPASAGAIYNWTADLFGEPYLADAADVSPLKPAAQTAQPPLFSALNEGLYDALNTTGEWLLNDHRNVRSVAWRDIRRYYGSIRRPQLWATLENCGFPRDACRFLEEVSQACGSTALGILPIDDAWGFLGNAYLLPVDRALSKHGRSFRRCADEYFLLAGDKADRVAAERLLAAELAKVHLALNRGKANDIEIVEHGLTDNENVCMTVEGFLLCIKAASNPPHLAESESVTVPSWNRMLRTALDAAPGVGSHNRTMTLLRTMHFARQADAPIWPRLAAPSSARGKNYQQALAEAEWLPLALNRRLEQALASRRTWPCYWLLVLLADIGIRGAPAVDVVLRLAQAAHTEPVLRALAMLALATTSAEAEAKPALSRLVLTGAETANRFNVAALFVAQQRWGGNWLAAAETNKHTRLIQYLETRRAT